MNMLAFDPIRAMNHDFLGVVQCLQKCIKMSEAVVRLELGVRVEELIRRRATSRIKN